MPLSHLSKPQRAHLLRLLLARAAVLRHEIDAALRDRQLLPADIARDAQELNDVSAALVRIDRPDFGICIDCGAAISWPRLNAQPCTQRCLPCEAREERLHAAPGSYALHIVPG